MSAPRPGTVLVDATETQGWRVTDGAWASQTETLEAALCTACGWWSVFVVRHTTRGRQTYYATLLSCRCDLERHQ